MRNSTTRLEGFADPIRKESSNDEAAGDPPARKESTTNNNGSANNGSKPTVSDYAVVLCLTPTSLHSTCCYCFFLTAVVHGGCTWWR
jgi:hypothetical protein